MSSPMDQSPLRIVSLLPSATELIDIVITENFERTGRVGAILVGRSHECDFPPSYSDVPMLTSSKIKFTTSEDVNRQVNEQLQTGIGLYSVDKDLLQRLKPDIIVTQSLCKVCSVDYCLIEDIVTQCMDPKTKLVDTNPMSLTDILNDVIKVAVALNMKEDGERARKKLQDRIDAAVAVVKENTDKKYSTPPNVAFLEWTVPIFPAGHWTAQLICMAGGLHPLNPPKDNHGAHHSAAITNETFAQSNPDIIIVAPCGLNLIETKRELLPLQNQPFWSELKAVSSGDVYLVDGNQMFNRPGPRIVDALEWLVSILQDRSDLCPPSFPFERCV